MSDGRHIRSDVNAAFDLIIRGFARLEQGVHPVEERVSGPVRYLNWPERGRRGSKFSEEFFALDLEPGKTRAAVRGANPGPDHLIADVGAGRNPEPDIYLAAGYEVGSQEPLMIIQVMDASPRDAAGLGIERVTTLAEVEQILAAHRSVGYPERLFSQSLLDDPQVRIRAVFADGAFAAIGKIAMVGPAASITDVMTMPAPPV